MKLSQGHHQVANILFLDLRIQLVEKLEEKKGQN